MPRHMQQMPYKEVPRVESCGDGWYREYCRGDDGERELQFSRRIMRRDHEFYSDGYVDIFVVRGDGGGDLPWYWFAEEFDDDGEPMSILCSRPNMFRHAWASAYYVCWDEPQYEDGWFPSADEAIDSCTAHMGSMGYLAEPNLAYFLRVTLENAIRNVQAALGDLGVYFDEVKLAFDDWSYYHVGRPTCSFIVRITDRDSFVQNVIGRMLGHYQLYDDMQRNYDRFIHGQAGRGFLCAGASALILISVAAALDVGGTEGEFLSYAYQRLKDGKGLLDDALDATAITFGACAALSLVIDGVHNRIMVLTDEDAEIGDDELTEQISRTGLGDGDDIDGAELAQEMEEDAFYDERMGLVLGTVSTIASFCYGRVTSALPIPDAPGMGDILSFQSDEDVDRYADYIGTVLAPGIEAGYNRWAKR